MSKHRTQRRAERPPVRGWLRSAKVRAVLSLGIVLGLGSAGTMAYWTDTATVTTGPIQSASLDLQIDGNLAGQGGSWTAPDLQMSGMMPGESVAATVPVERAAGTVAFTYTATATASGGLAPYLRWTVSAGVAGEPGTSANGLRTATCEGPVLGGPMVLSQDPAPVIAEARALAGDAMAENLCIRAELPADAGNSAQGQSAAAVVTIDARQVS